MNHDKILCLKGYFLYWEGNILLYLLAAFHIPFSKLTIALSGSITTELQYGLVLNSKCNRNLRHCDGKQVGVMLTSDNLPGTS